MLFKRYISILLIFILIFILVSPCFAMIGDEKAETHNISGDIEAEKSQEGQLFVPFGLAATTSAPAIVTVSGPFGLLVGGIGTATMGLGMIADPEYATWENWPMSRWSFDHAEPEGGWGFSSMAEKATSGTMDMFANIIFFITKSLTRLSINMLVWAFNLNIVKGMTEWVSEGIQTMFDYESDLTFLLINWGIIVLLICSIFYFLKGKLSSIVSALLIAVIAVGGAFFFTANSNTIIEDVNDGFNKVSGVALGVVGSYTTEGQSVNTPNPLNKGIILCGKSVWNVIVALPWSIALFGTADENDLKLTNEEAGHIRNNIEDYVSPTKLNLIHPGSRADTIYLATMGEARKQVVEVLAAPKDINHGRHPGTVVGLSSYSTTNHVITAGLTLFPALAFFLLVVMIALPVIFAQGMIGAMLLLLPAALFAMIVPVHGWGLATGYFKKLLNFFLIKLILGFYLSIVITIGTAFALAALQVSVGLAAFILTVIFGGAVFMRKKFYNSVLNTARHSYNNNKNSLSKMRTAMKTMATLKMIRNISIADALMDFKSLRSRKSTGSLNPESKKPGASNIGVDKSEGKSASTSPLVNKPIGNKTNNTNNSDNNNNAAYNKPLEENENSGNQHSKKMDKQQFPENNKKQGVDLNTSKAIPIKVKGERNNNHHSNQDNVSINKDRTVHQVKNNNKARPSSSTLNPNKPAAKEKINSAGSNSSIIPKRQNNISQSQTYTVKSRGIDNSLAAPKNKHDVMTERNSYKQDEDTDNPLNQVNLNNKDL